MVKTTKGGKTMNPTDAYRKEIRKKEIKRNKKERKKVREVGILKKDPDSLKDQIQKLEAMKADGALDKARKHKKRQLEDTLNLVIKKRKEYEEKIKEKGEAPVMFSHLGPVRNRTVEDEERANHPRPEDSVYYHPTLNPSGAPPPGKPQMFNPSVGLASNVASSSKSETDDGMLSAPPLPPPPPPPSGLGSLPLPPPPPMPPKPSTEDNAVSLPLLPPPPPGPPPKELVSVRPPPPVLHSVHPPPPGTVGNEKATISNDTVEAPSVIPPPPLPAGIPQNSGYNRPEGPISESDQKAPSDTKDLLKIPPPLIRQQSVGPGPAAGLNFQPNVLPPGFSQYLPPPPPPIDMGSNFQPNLLHSGFSQFLPPPPPPTEMGQHMSAPGVAASEIMPRPPFGPPPGHPLMMRPPLPPGPPPFPQEDFGARPFVAQKPSYVKSAASTVVKRPLAQHTPELTAMIPASVRVRRETALPKPKPKTASSSTNILAPNRPIVAVAPPVPKQVSTSSSSFSAPKPPSVDDSYMAFLEDMKALGALDG